MKRLLSSRGKPGTGWKSALLPILFLIILGPDLGCNPFPRHYDPPGKTAWEPEGCRSVPVENAVLGPRTYWRNIHADALNSDEVSVALAPVIRLDWIAEPDKLVITGTSFDRNGNIYFSPLWPGEQVVLVSLEPEQGIRRWALPGFGSGAGAPMIADDPDRPGEQAVYLGLYEEVIAVGTDGTVLWRKPTGLPPPSGSLFPICFGINYHPGADALLGITRDGHLYALDRSSGNSLLATPHRLPGENSPPIPPWIPEGLKSQYLEVLGPLIAGIPDESLLEDMIAVLGGRNSRVANFFSVDPGSGRIWVAATAPDAEDGKADGVSEFGALYGLDLVPGSGAAPYTLVESCHLYFDGGSVSTPTLRSDGTRVYLGDGMGKLITCNSSCEKIWEVNLRVGASIAVASDNGELYAFSGSNIVKVIDLGTSGEIAWMADLDMYVVGPGHENFIPIGVGVGANGIYFQGAAGPSMLPVVIGTGLLDRRTGKIRYFSDGGEETSALMSIGPGGDLYLAHSPLRRAVARLLYPDLTSPVTGGVGKYGPQRFDLLIREAACAASARAGNAFEHAGACPDSGEADIVQIRELIAQCRYSAPRAVAAGDLTPEQWTLIEPILTEAEADMSLDTLDRAAGRLEAVCGFW